jgi:Uma2 family endonuclease
MVTPIVAVERTKIFSFEDWLENPPEGTEWVEGNLVQKNGMTLKHSEIQSNLSFYWRVYKDSMEQGGKVYTEAPCRTNKQGRSPDVAYLTPELVAQYGNEKVLPQSFPLIAEIVSPTDCAEALIAKAQEYLESGSLEVWLVFPENRWIIIITQDTRKIFISGEVVTSQVVLPGFSISIDQLFP